MKEQNMEKNDSNYYSFKGSFTLEIALLMPFLLLTLLLSVYLSFYIYDRLLITQSTFIAAYRGSRELNQNNDAVYQKTKEELEQLLDNQLLAFVGREDKITVRYGEIEVQVEGTINIPFRIVSNSSQTAEGWSINIKNYVNRLEPEDFIRNVRRLENIIKKEQ